VLEPFAWYGSGQLFVPAQYDGERPEHVDVARRTLPSSDPAMTEAFMHVPPSTGRLAMVINAGATETVALRTRRRLEDVGCKAPEDKELSGRTRQQ
jgi:hypothetical protein